MRKEYAHFYRLSEGGKHFCVQSISEGCAVKIFYTVVDSTKQKESGIWLVKNETDRRLQIIYRNFEIKRPIAFFNSRGERTLVDSLVIVRRIASSFSSLEKLLVEYFLKRRLTISNLESLLGSMLHT